MKQTLILTGLLFSLLFISGGCAADRRSSDLKKISGLEADVSTARKNNLSQQKADLFSFQELAIAYVDFADKYPEDSLSPDMLFKSAELYTKELQNIPRAIELFQRNYQDYPKHPTAPNALFTQAYLYNNILSDGPKAEASYKLFIEKYPDHKLAESARFELEHIGQRPEESLKNLLGNQENTVQDSQAH